MTLQILIPFLFFFGRRAEAVRFPETTVEPDAIWLRITDQSGKFEYYLDTAKTGETVLRLEGRNTGITTRHGNIPPSEVKDLFQEVDNSDAFDSEGERGREIFFMGSIIELSAYWKGELRTIKVSSSTLGEGFGLALKQVRKSAAGLPPWKEVKLFLCATPLNSDDIEKMRRDGIDTDFTKVESSDIDRVKPLGTAILNPYRLIPMSEPDNTAKEKFIDKYNLKGFRDLFYMATSRGNFKISTLEAFHSAPSEPAKNAGKKTKAPPSSGKTKHIGKTIKKPETYSIPVLEH